MGIPLFCVYESGAIILIAAACWIISRVGIASEDE